MCKPLIYSIFVVLPLKKCLFPPIYYVLSTLFLPLLYI
nr:MAG TPA: hypothetical protein [Caudoviricetes sp.]